MPAYPTVLIPARISRGGFGNERTYKIRSASGNDFTGLAAWPYCFDEKVRRIEEEPQEEVTGFIEARVVNGAPDGAAKVWLPDGEVCYVARSELRSDLTIPPKPEATNVPV